MRRRVRYTAVATAMTSSASTPRPIKSTAGATLDEPWPVGLREVRARPGAEVPGAGGADDFCVLEPIVPVKPDCPLQHNR